MKKCFTLIELIMIIVVVGIITVIAIPNLTRTYMITNENAAEANLRIISAALENYATANNGVYPTAESSLTGATPPYLNRSYCGQTIGGYTYDCSGLAAGSYSVVATPSSCGKSGSETYTITTGGVLATASCS